MKNILRVIIALFIVSPLFGQIQWKKAQVDSLHIGFEYPANWSYEVTEDGISSEGLVLGNDNNAAAFNYNFFNIPIELSSSYDNLRLLVNEMVKDSTSGFGTIPLDSLKETKLGGLNAVSFTMDQLEEGETVQIVFYIVILKKGMGIFFYGDDKKQFKASYDKYFSHILSTIKFID